MSKVLRRRMVDELVKKHEKQKNFVLVNAAGMTSNQAVELRRDLREAKAKLTVLKNSVAHHAFEKMGLKDLQKHLTGMNALVTGSDPVVLAKKLTAFREKTEKAQVRGASVEGKALTPADVAAMSKLPGREELLSILLGTMQAPAQQMVNVLQESVRQVLNVLSAYEAKLKETKA
jgi:large subunit ribosomal protein L10